MGVFFGVATSPEGVLTTKSSLSRRLPSSMLLITRGLRSASAFC